MRHQLKDKTMTKDNLDSKSLLIRRLLPILVSSVLLLESLFKSSSMQCEVVIFSFYSLMNPTDKTNTE